MQNFISINKSVNEIYLHWNKISGIGGTLIFESLRNDQNIKVLDISWNDIGKKCKIKYFCDFFEKNETLRLYLYIVNLMKIYVFFFN